MNSPSEPKKCIEISWTSIIKVPVVAVAVYLLYLLLPFAIILYLSAMLAVTLDPIVEHLAKAVGRKWSIGLIAAFLAVLLIAIGLLIVPEMMSQISHIAKKLPELPRWISQKFPWAAHYVQDLPQQVESGDAVSPVVQHAAKVTAVALGAASSAVLVFVFMIYLLIDGRRVYAWLLAFFRPMTRVKIQATCDGVAPVVSAYVSGQVVTSTLCSLFAYGILWWLNVPAALVLAIVAGVFDVLPIIGFFLFTIPAAMFALTVSVQAALIVVFLFGCYHLFEAYLISPLVYGNRLRVSGIVVLSSLIAGGAIGGILGAIAILPIVASYPVVEKIWLAKFLGQNVVTEHKEIAAAPEEPPRT